MEVLWKKGTPPVSGKLLFSDMVVVKTNLGYLNIGIYSTFFNDWLCFAPMSSTEQVVEWLEGLETKCTQ